MSILDDAKGVLERILKLMNFPATIEGKETDDMVLLTIASEDANIIIGQKGKNLDALQYIVNRIVHRGKEERKSSKVGVPGTQFPGNSKVPLPPSLTTPLPVRVIGGEGGRRGSSVVI